MLGIVSILLLSAAPPDLPPRDGETAITFELGSGLDFTAVADHIIWFGPESFSLVGHAPGEPDKALTIAVRRGVLWASLRSKASDRRIRPDGASYRIEKVRSEVFRPAREPLTVAKGGTVGADLVDDGSLLDLLVVYTGKARAAAGGARAIESLVQLGVTDANLAFARSGVGTRLRLVQVAQIDYEEAGDVEGDLELLARPFDGAADEVHALRNAYGADLVQLVVEEHDGCGNAYLMGGDEPGFEAWAFSVVEWDCVDSSFGLLHELGHNLGCDHAPEDPTSEGAFAFSHGYKDLSAGFRTVMAYGPGRRLARFSNPRRTFRGFATGDSSSDNARSINAVRRTVANFRASLPRPRLKARPPDSPGDGWHFSWDVAPSIPVSEWWLVLGTEIGARDRFDSGSLGEARSLSVAEMTWPDGVLYARLWYRRGTVWLFEDFVLRMP